MNIKLIPTLISLGIALLIAYACMTINGVEPDKWFLLVGSFVSIFITLFLGFGVSYGNKGISVTALSIVFLIIFLVMNGISSFLFNETAYIVIGGIALLIYVGIVYALSKALKEV